MKENRIIIITMILNLIVAVIKLISGVVFSFSTLIADSIQSLMDFITDITSLMANKIGKRRANKTYPFGFGQVYYLANLFTGFLLFLIGIFILYQFFFFKEKLVPNFRILIFLGIVLLIKSIVLILLNYFGKKYKSELMIDAFKESQADFTSTIVVLIVFILTVVEKYIPIDINVDKIGSFGMAIYVFTISIKMIISNIRGILTNDEENNDIKDEIIEELNEFKDFKFENIKIIKMSTYYSVFLSVKVDGDLTMRRYLRLEKKLKKRLKNKNRLIRFIDVEPE